MLTHDVGEIWEVEDNITGKRVGCTSNPLHVGDRISFPDNPDTPYVVKDFNVDTKTYYVEFTWLDS